MGGGTGRCQVQTGGSEGTEFLLKMDFNQTTAGSQGFQCVKVSVDTFS